MDYKQLQRARAEEAKRFWGKSGVDHDGNTVFIARPEGRIFWARKIEGRKELEKLAGWGVSFVGAANGYLVQEAVIEGNMLVLHDITDGFKPRTVVTKLVHAQQAVERHLRAPERDAERERERAERRADEIRAKLDRLIAHTTGEALREALADYEATGNHNHGGGSIPVGDPCGGGGGAGDCWVAKARKALALLEGRAS